MKKQFIDPRTASEQDFAQCFRYILNATITSGGTKTVNGRQYTLLKVVSTSADGTERHRFALGHPAITYAKRIGETVTFEYYTGALSILDETTGVVYDRLALDPTEEELQAYQERLARAEARAKEFSARPKAHAIKYFD